MPIQSFNNPQQSLVFRKLIAVMGAVGVSFGILARNNPGVFGPIFSPRTDAAMFSLFGTFFCICYLVAEIARN